MSKKQSTRRAEFGNAPDTRASHHDWLAPVSDTTPCGPDLEYDHDFVVLLASVMPKQDVQYGTFVGSPEPVNWSELERDCRRVMMRTKDIRVAVLYTRARTRLAGAAGLEEGTALLAAWLNAFAEDIHPQPGSDIDREAALEMRMNALQALTDPEGLLADVREIVLTKSTMTHLQVRDVERAFAHPRAADALAPDSVTQQLRDLYAQQPGVMTDFHETIAHLAAIDAWCIENLGTHCPDLSPLSRIIALVRMHESHIAPAPASAAPAQAADPAQAGHAAAAYEHTPAASQCNERAGETARAVLAPCTGAIPVDRQGALALIRAARQWFEMNEPSSPLPVLLKRAEQFVGKRYAQVVRAIPVELLAEWERSEVGS